jgi:fibro-slime domain-containing protein
MKLTVAAAALFGMFPWYLSAQTLPDTIWMPVTFYDFHSDATNPEFEQPHQGGLRLGMVADTLDRDSLPVPGPSIYMNSCMKYWFRPWEDSAKGDFTRPSYDANGNFLGTVAANHDTSFKNIAIRDTLPFRHVGMGNYEFDRSGVAGVSEFFWIDGRGFGNEGRAHNYSFTMKMHTIFTYRPGLRFNFRGDDDVWMFINGKLAMDVGGIHTPIDQNFDLDIINTSGSLGLVVGKKYDLHIFYAERHTVMSTIRITTNLVSPCPCSLYFAIEAPSDSIVCGDSMTFRAIVLDDTGGIRTDLMEMVEWKYCDGL